MQGTFPRVHELGYRPDSASYLEALRHLPWPVLLDSRGASGEGRVDIVAADPFMRLITDGQETRIHHREGSRDLSTKDPFSLVRKALGARTQAFPWLPFEGGAIGYFGYDLGRRLERLPVVAEDADGLPEMCLGIYDWAVVVNHAEQRTWLVGQGRDPHTPARWEDLVARLGDPPQSVATKPLRACGPLQQSLTREQYGERFDRIQTFIREGDCYQVNFALRFELPVEGDPWAGYLAIRERNPVPFGAFLQYGDFAVLSFSPERFMRLDDDRVETRPIKGTRPRGATQEEDQWQREELEASAKDRAENLMIVDLLRNDLGRVCIPGSIEARRLFEVESFPTVHHLVSTVSGRLRPGQDAPGLLSACFPGGSITGAPKIRAMEIIESLEPQRRVVYCGAIGYLGFNGGMDTNIAIRTLTVKGDKAWFWAGGGIVADSVEEAEYAECLSKAGFLIDYFGGWSGIVQEAPPDPGRGG